MEEPNPIDIHIGERMKARRTALGMTQQDLGSGLGVSFQQVQKYERGNNRVASSTLYDAAKVLKVSILYFFSGLGETTTLQDDERALIDSVFSLSGGHEFISGYISLEPAQRASINTLINTMQPKA